MFNRSKREVTPETPSRGSSDSRGARLNENVSVRQRTFPQSVIETKVDGGGLNLLSSYIFDDLYLPEARNELISVRRLRLSSKAFRGENKPGLAPLPPELKADVDELFEAVRKGWRMHECRREFVIDFKGLAYRCALIGPPGLYPTEESLMGTEWCVRMVSPKIPSLSDLRLPQTVVDDLQSLTDARGIVLVGGPFASGKTTLASVGLDLWVRNSNEMGITMEDPPEIPMQRNDPKIGKIIQIDTTGQSIEQAIKDSRRWSFRYLFLGEIRSADVASSMLHIGISGPLVVCTIHANTPADAVRSLYRFAAERMSEGAARDMIADSLQHIFHQKIVGSRAILRSIKVCGNGGELLRSQIKSGDFMRLEHEISRIELSRKNEQTE